MITNSRRTKYQLMNKNEEVLSFLCERNEFDEPEFYELQWHVEYRPLGYKSLAGFLERQSIANIFSGFWSNTGVMI